MLIIPDSGFAYLTSCDDSEMTPWELETNGPMHVTHRGSGAGKSWLKHTPGAEETNAEDLPKKRKVSEKAPAAVNNYKVNRDGSTCSPAGRRHTTHGASKTGNGVHRLRTCTARKLIIHNVLLQSKGFYWFKE